MFELRKLQSFNALRASFVKQILQKKFSLSACKKTTENITPQTPATETKTDKNCELVKEKSDVPYVIKEQDQPIVNDLKKGNIIYPYKDPWDRASSIFMNDLKCNMRKLVYNVSGVKTGELEVKFIPKFVDVLIIGGGAIGIMTAFQIKNKFPFGGDVIVLDRESIFPPLSVNLSQGTLTQQLFTEIEEIQMSQYCAEFLSSFHRLTEVQGHSEFTIPYEPLGSLLLADESNAKNLLKKSEIMKMHGVRHKLLESEVLKKLFPWLNLDGVLFGSLGMTSEGLYDPWAVLLSIKSKAVNQGVIFVTAEVIDIAEKNNMPQRVVYRLKDGSYNTIDFSYCVIAAGKETLKITQLINNTDISPLKLDLPIEERKRYEYCFHNPDGPGLNTPIVIDSDGTYFRREGLSGYYVVGVPSVPCDENEENGLYEVFNSKVKPFLMKRIPGFEKFELVNGWADTYDYNRGNEVGIVGPHPDDTRLIFANGFNQHGLQYIPAVGRGIMEWMYYDKYQTIDLRAFHIQNLYHKQHMEAEQKRKERIATEHRAALSD